MDDKKEELIYRDKYIQAAYNDTRACRSCGSIICLHKQFLSKKMVGKKLTLKGCTNKPKKFSEHKHYSIVKKKMNPRKKRKKQNLTQQQL